MTNQDPAAQVGDTLQTEPGQSRRKIWLGPLLVIQAILGGIVALTVPNLLNAIDRGHQKRMMSDLRTIGTAVESYQVDNGIAPKVVGDKLAAGPVLRPHLVPTYVRELPDRDPWNEPYLWSRTGGEGYSLVSTGKDARVNPGVPIGAITSFDADIYYSSGQFTVFPEGTMN